MEVNNGFRFSLRGCLFLFLFFSSRLGHMERECPCVIFEHVLNCKNEYQYGLYLRASALNVGSKDGLEDMGSPPPLP